MDLSGIGALLSVLIENVNEAISKHDPTQHPLLYAEVIVYAEVEEVQGILIQVDSTHLYLEPTKEIVRADKADLVLLPRNTAVIYRVRPPSKPET